MSNSKCRLMPGTSGLGPQASGLSAEKAWDHFVRELGQAGSHLLLCRLHAESLCRSDEERARVRTAFEERHRELLEIRVLVRELQRPIAREILS